MNDFKETDFGQIEYLDKEEIILTQSSDRILFYTMD